MQLGRNKGGLCERFVALAYNLKGDIFLRVKLYSYFAIDNLINWSTLSCAFSDSETFCTTLPKWEQSKFSGILLICLEITKFVLTEKRRGHIYGPFYKSVKNGIERLNCWIKSEKLQYNHKGIINIYLHLAISYSSYSNRCIK